MFENKDTLINQLNSPMNIAAMALDEIHDRLNGTRIIADPNSPFCHLLEFGSSISAMTIQAIEEKFPLLYAQRAQSMEDLFMHMSDYDYLSLYATPASTTLRMAFPKKYLIDNALKYNDNYKQVTIPKDTVFMIGKYPFGIYYPINILINNYTRTFTVVYDTTYSNPLHELNKNIVDKYDITYGSLDYLVIDVPIYQFARSTEELIIDRSLGFIKKFTYNNQFYAVRVFNYKNGKYSEMGQSLNQIIYDTSNPTLLLQVMQDIQKLKITIPQIYFDNGDMGSKLFFEFYTTLGPLDIDTTKIAGSNIRVDFALKNKDTTEYSAILKNLPFDTIMTLNGNKIIGGSNAITLETLRKRIIHDNLVHSVPITEDDIAVYLEDNGFYVKKFKDNVTQRIYYAYRILTDTDGSIIPSMTLQMRMIDSYTDSSKYKGFVNQLDGSITVLPTTLYKYQKETEDAIPLTIDELDVISKMDKSQLVDTLNNQQYLRSPFHIRFDLNDDNPHAVSYNLMTPSIDKLIFVNENYNISSKIMTYDALIQHIGDGVGGYDVALSVAKSDDLTDVSEDDILIYVFVKTTAGYTIGLRVNYVQKMNERYLYKFHIDTNYHLTENNEISITNFQNENYSLSEHLVPLTSNFYLVHMVRASVLQGVNIEPSSNAVSNGVPDSYLKDFVALTRQYVTISLGHSLKDVINNNIEISVGGTKYDTWEYDVEDSYENDVYARTIDGMLKYTVDDNNGVKLYKEHSIGDTKIDENGNTVYLHRKGDVRYSKNGEPIIAIPSFKRFYTDMMFVDAKVFASERTAELTFTSTLPRILESYFDTVRNLQKQLLERTTVFFRAVRTAGTATFNIGNGITSTQNIEMSFHIKCYVQSYVKQDVAIQQTITSYICTAIEDAIQTKNINMMDIFSSVKEKLSDYVEHFTLLGINDDTTNQTFIIMDEDAQPSLKRRLVLTEDNILSLSKSLDIEFVALENNTDEMAIYDV